MTTGILLINIGTPESPAVPDVRRYLRQFLSDPCVVDIPYFIRLILLEAFILPTRPQKSARAYQSIWTAAGSPLLVHCQRLAEQLQQQVGDNFKVALGMRYGEPSIASALEKLLTTCDKLVIQPLFPQYSKAATGSAMQAVFEHLAAKPVIPAVTMGGDFFDHPFFIDAQASIAKEALQGFTPDHWLMSYHGLPVRQVAASEDKSIACDRLAPCPQITAHNRFCYRAQSYASSRALAARLQLKPEDYTVSFQSRLGRTPWIKPYTDEILMTLRERGINDLAVICPSFVADCLETLEEIGIRAKEQWLLLGGRSLRLLPCVNSHPAWVVGLAKLVNPS